MMQSIAGISYQSQIVDRLTNLFKDADYVWDRDILTDERIMLVCTDDVGGEGQKKLDYLKYMIYSEGYGA